MKVSITGATGFVGQNLTQYLLSHTINCEALSLRESEWITRLDMTSDAIVHLAGKAHDTSNTARAEDYFKVNRDLTIALFDEFLHSDIKDFFFFSSVKAAADIVDGVLLEDDIPNPITPYGLSKIEAEKYLLSKVLPDGKRLFIIRPCLIHGPGNKGNLNLLYKVVEKGIPWPLATFDNQRSFLSIENLSYLIKEMIMNKDLSTGVYNFADDEALSTNELVSLIAKTLGKSLKLWHVPAVAIKAAVKLGDVLPLPLNSERLKKLTESYVVSNEKIKKALGIEKLPLTAKEGLEKTIRSFKEK